ncbi:RCC1 domain-containing protein [Fluviispira sanaruensis]|uniref:Chromosome condensation regulator RCC1 n=1 Tax=Fluviispira sanaruensis TaxID=2493639 RepID=A0A4P2VVK6_FLUSA|nr:hypothetical protein [Fluviispira sanaruensis]BBH53575.1 chromosome condensation regulator RCC1 [Fluviispira sanaruensis]
MKKKLVYLSYSCLLLAHGATLADAANNSRKKRSVIWNRTGLFSSIYSNNNSYCSLSENSANLTCFNLYSDFTRLPPNQSEILGNFSSVSLGDNHSCGINSEDSSIYCWGQKKYSSLSNGNPGDENIPKKILLEKTFKTINVSRKNSYAIDSDGYLWGWGDTSQGQLPVFHSTNINNNIGEIFEAQQIDLAGKTFLSVASGDGFFCALTNEVSTNNNVEKSGHIYCAGNNSFGQTGQRNFAGNSTELVQVNNNKYLEIAAGDSHVCAINLDRKVECWGNNSFGQLSYNPILNSYLSNPSPVVHFENPDFAKLNFKSLSLSNYSSCAITTEDISYCFGDNTFGQIGGDPKEGSLEIKNRNGFSNYAHFKPKKLMPSPIISIAGNSRSTCVVTQNKDIQCFGFIQKNTYSSVSVGSNYICGISSFKTRAFCSSFNGSISDILANPWSAPLVTPWASPQAFTQVSVGFDHTCAVSNESPLNSYCWSNPESSSATQRTYPQVITSLTSPMKKIVVGNSHSCAIRKEDGALFCAGENNYGQLGNGTFTNSLNATEFTQVSINNVQFIDLALSGNATCALSAKHEVYCFGSNAKGELGLGISYRNKKKTPEKIENLKLLSIVGGEKHFCGIKKTKKAKENKVVCWGDNSEEQIAYSGDKINKPVDLANTKNMTQITAQGSTTCMLSDKQEAYCLGKNQNGIIDPIKLRENFSRIKRVQAHKKFKSLSLGENQACGILTLDNTLACWGKSH